MRSDVWRTLADPTRRAILDRLKGEPLTTGQLCEAFSELDRCTVMKHLEVLVAASLVVSERHGRTRLNHMNPGPLQEIVERWVSGHTAAVASAALKMKRRLEERMESAQIRQIVVEVPIQAPCEQVWKAMLEELPEWWPQDFLSLPGAEKIRFEPWAGGRLYEETPDGRQILWATVVMILPGKAIEFVGYMTPTYGGPSVTMYRLEVNAKDDGTTLFKLSDAVMGRIDDEQEAGLTEGWTYLFGTGLKEYVERQAA